MVTQKQLNESHRQALGIAETIERLTLELHSHKDILAMAGSGKHTTDSGTFLVSENNVYDAEQMEAALSKGQWQRCSERVLRKALVKALYPKVYAAAKKRQGWKVSL